MPVSQYPRSVITAEAEKFLAGHQTPITLSRLFTSNILTMTQEIDHVLPLDWCSACSQYQETLTTHSQSDSLADVVQRIIQHQEVA